GGRAGIDLRTLQELAGHSTPVLTARYSHRRLYDLAGAVEKLPSILPVPPVPQAEAQPLRATGTDGPAHTPPSAQQPAQSDSGESLPFPRSGPVGPINKGERENPAMNPSEQPGRGERENVKGVQPEKATTEVRFGCTLVAQTPALSGHSVAS